MLENFLKRISDHSFMVTKPTPIQIGMPESPPSDDAIQAIKSAVSSTGATTVYWFWVSIAGDSPHLGLAVAPNDNDIVSRVGCAVEPLWRKYSPDNTVFDILRLGNSKLDRQIIEKGILLFSSRW